ncbi:MAG: integrase, partial [Bacteroides xylanisolvens]
LKGFELKERTEVNKGNLSYVRNCSVGSPKIVKC